MNDKTYADGIEDAAKVAEEDMTPGYGPHRNDMEALAAIQRANIAHRIRSLTPDKTNTSEATAIGAGEVDRDPRCLCCCRPKSEHVRGQCQETTYFTAAASPKPDTNTSVDPGGAGVREAAKAMADAWDEDPDGEAVCEARNRVRAALATIDHPIARSGMPEGYVLVPIDPTKEMIAAGIDAAEEVEDWTRDTEGSYRVDTPSDAVLPTYRAMIAAALSPQQDQSR